MTTEQRRIPVPMTTDELADTLTRLAEAIRKGDSLEGSFEYLLPDPDEKHDGDMMYGGCPHVMVTAAFRVGNRQGQGGMEFIGDWTEVAATCGATYDWPDDQQVQHCLRAADHNGLHEAEIDGRRLQWSQLPTEQTGASR